MGILSPTVSADLQGVIARCEAVFPTISIRHHCPPAGFWCDSVSLDVNVLPRFFRGARTHEGRGDTERLRLFHRRHHGSPERKAITWTLEQLSLEEGP